MSTVPDSETELSIDYVDLESGAEIVDRQARKQLDMSGPEFVRSYKSGQLEDFDSDTVFRVAIFLPFVGESLGYRQMP